MAGDFGKACIVITRNLGALKIGVVFRSEKDRKCLIPHTVREDALVKVPSEKTRSLTRREVSFRSVPNSVYKNIDY